MRKLLKICRYFELCFRSDKDKIYVYHLHLNESGI